MADYILCTEKESDAKFEAQLLRDTGYQVKLDKVDSLRVDDATNPGKRSFDVYNFGLKYWRVFATGGDFYSFAQRKAQALAEARDNS